MSARPFAFIALAASIAFAAQPKAGAPLTEVQRTQILREAKAVVRAMGDAAQRLDIDGAAKDFIEGPDLILVGSEGQPVGRQDLREGLGALYASLASMRFTTLREEARVLAPDLVLYVWTYKVEGAQKKGAAWVIDTETASFLLRRIDGARKFVFFQESASPQKRLPATAAK